MTRELPFTVIGGYLDAGKTTLLNHLLTHARDLRVAALVNEFGSVSIDAETARTGCPVSRRSGLSSEAREAPRP